jgi:site-specific recombinase XerD
VGVKTRREVLRYLRKVGAGGGPLWVSVRGGGRITYWGLRQIIRRRAAKAEVEAPTLHSFRRAFALLSLRNGADIYSLQKLMGHAGLSVLRRYLRQTEDDLREAHRKAGPVDNLL